MKKTLLCLILLFTLFSCSPKEAESLQTKIEGIISTVNATCGVGIYNLSTGESYYQNGDESFALMSVVKFHQALYILSRVDRGQLSLDQEILFERSSLNSNSYCPLLAEVSDSLFSITLDEALSYTVSKSDNNVCDRLFADFGVPEEVNRFISSLGVSKTQISTDYSQMKRYDANRTTPKDMVKLFKAFENSKVLSTKSSEVLWQKLVETSTGSKRLKAGLPAKVMLGHKTGSSGTTPSGFTAVHNDVGIMQLPNGNKVIVVVFIKDSREKPEKNDEIMSKIATVAYDFWRKK